MRSEKRVVQLDTEQVKALAQPLRARLLAALRTYGPDTATGLAHRLSSNSGATSYHLRQLAAVGLVEEEPAQGTGRQRVWRSAHDSTTWSELDVDDEPDGRVAADWLYGHHIRAHVRWIEDWYESRREWSETWRRAADSSDYAVTLTPAGLQRLNERLHEVLQQVVEEDDDPASVRCTVVLHTFPSPEPRV